MANRAWEPGIFTAFALLAACGCGGGGTSAPPIDPGAPADSIETSLRGLWDYQQELIEASPGQVFDRAVQGFDPRTYPSESAVSFLSAHAFTGNERYLHSAKRQLEMARSLVNADHILPFHGSEPVAAKVSQARLIWGYCMAYLATRDKLYLDCADDAAQGMLLLKRSPTEWKGQSYILFHYTYHNSPPYSPIEGALIDPNQEAIIGLAFTMLYHTPGSRFNGRTEIKALAQENLDAAIAMQTADGKLPLAQFRPKDYDTMYGSFALMGVFWGNQYWRESRYEMALQRGAGWLASLTVKGISERYYPNLYKGPTKEPVELFYRLPILYHYGQNVPEIKQQLARLMSGWRTFADVPAGWIAPTLPMEWMGVPKREFE